MSSEKFKVAIIKDGLQVGTQPIAVGGVLEVDSDRKRWLEKREFVASSEDATPSAAATTAATTNTPSKSKAAGLPSPSTAEEAK